MQVIKATALKPWRGCCGQDLCCSDVVVTSRAIETVSMTCLESMKWCRPRPSRQCVTAVRTSRVTNESFAQECYQQSDQLRRHDVERIGPIRFQWCSSMSCRASGRGGVLGIALMWTTYGKVYNGITDDDTHDDILNLSIVCLLWCWGLVVCRVAGRVLPGASLVLPCVRFPCCFALCDQDEVLNLGQS